MNLVPSRVSLGFEVTFDSPSLDVAMRVFNDAGALVGSPIPMINVFGNTYRGFFTPSDNTGYLVHKAVYTDNTYTEIDSNYSQGSETIYAENLGGSNGTGGCSVVGYVVENETVIGFVDDNNDVIGLINC